LILDSITKRFLVATTEIWVIQHNPYVMIENTKTSFFRRLTPKNENSWHPWPPASSVPSSACMNRSFETMPAKAGIYRAEPGAPFSTPPLHRWGLIPDEMGMSGMAARPENSQKNL
jgi:hypothetical protein